mmetsp:Transcript_4364/g.7722  ORF Transcript_4364/g.7722 Transcript_4364/m.7722 type:complete len:218 (-) Transcript_4364:212-865(-)
MFDQPLRKEGQDAPQTFLVSFNHVDEVLKSLFLDHGLLNEISAFLCLKEASHSDKLYHVCKFMDADEPVLVCIEHLSESPALLTRDGLPLPLRQVDYYVYEVIGGQLTTIFLIKLTKVLLALLPELLGFDASAQLRWQKRHNYAQIVAGSLQSHHESFYLARCDHTATIYASINTATHGLAHTAALGIGPFIYFLCRVLGGLINRTIVGLKLLRRSI